ncbi:MAG: FHA domain-containing protein [Planctomycetota bacterium]
MRLVVRQGDKQINDLHFVKGPIYIGRHVGSQVFLADRAVSRQHAVIYSSQDGQWLVEDLNSANKTYLNDEAIHKTSIKSGDMLRIGDFTIEVQFETTLAALDEPIDLADTLQTGVHEPQTIIRKVSGDDAPMIRMPAGRARDFSRAVASLNGAQVIEKLLADLLDVLLKQFTGFRAWGELRMDAEGAMTCQGGKKRNSETVNLGDLILEERINYALDNKANILVPRIPAEKGRQRVRSAIIAPVVSGPDCHGVLYVDNSVEHEHYSLTDLDYLMFLAIHTAAILKRL